MNKYTKKPYNITSNITSELSVQDPIRYKCKHIDSYRRINPRNKK